VQSRRSRDKEPIQWELATSHPQGNDVQPDAEGEPCRVGVAYCNFKGLRATEFRRGTVNCVLGYRHMVFSVSTLAPSLSPA
jgi:hypothetical protein